MNSVILQDIVFKIYTKLPHCVILRKKHIQNARSRFRYDELRDISIMSANCVGGEIYSLLGLKYTSPLINVSINRDSFITLCANLKEYLELPILVNVSDGKCVGKLGDKNRLEEVEIRFPHDTDPEKVRAKWEERCKRVNYEKLVLINDDKGLTEDDYERYEAILAFRKICLTAKNMSERYPFCYQLKEYSDRNRTGEYNGKSLDGLWRFTKMWDYVSFLNGD